MARSLRIGVMMENCQLSDIIGIDIFGNVSKDYINEVSTEFKEFAALAGSGIDITWYYMAKTLDPARTTPSHFRVMPNVTYDDCPRDLDIVLTGGPAMSHRPAEADRFIKEAWEKTRVWMTTCTGSAWIADSGVLSGQKATTNRGFLPALKHLHPNVEWLDQRWVIDEKPYSGEGKGELWTSGGAGAGIDMIATYALKTFDQSLVKTMALDPLQFNPEESSTQFYKS